MNERRLTPSDWRYYVPAVAIGFTTGVLLSLGMWKWG